MARRRLPCLSPIAKDSHPGGIDGQQKAPLSKDKSQDGSANYRRLTAFDAHALYNQAATACSTNNSVSCENAEIKPFLQALRFSRCAATDFRMLIFRERITTVLLDARRNFFVHVGDEVTSITV